MKKRIPAIIIVSVALIFAVVSFILLPDTVATQYSTYDAEPTKLPRIAAVLVPTLICLAGALAAIIGEKGSKKPYFISGVGLFVFVILILVNV